jgi:hypothetical protein
MQDLEATAIVEAPKAATSLQAIRDVSMCIDIWKSDDIGSRPTIRQHADIPIV